MKNQVSRLLRVLGVFAFLLFVVQGKPLLAQQKTEVRVAAAADLKFAMGEVAAEFKKATGTEVSATFGSSGNFFSQLQNGAPFDVFFSADIDYPRKLESAGLTEPETLYLYAVGRIVIWMPKESPVDLQNQGWKALQDSSVQKIAIANPEHAPYGRAAVAALTKAGLYDEVKPKLVLGENISQAAQFVQSGNAQAGIVAMSLAISPAMKDGKSWEIPTDMHPTIEQAAVVMKDAKNKEQAKAFLEFMKSDAVKKIMQKYGFTMPKAQAAAAKS
jgi:molybdate transport system substrate-binding protein